MIDSNELYEKLSQKVKESENLINKDSLTKWLKQGINNGTTSMEADFEKTDLLAYVIHNATTVTLQNVLNQINQTEVMK